LNDNKVIADGNKNLEDKNKKLVLAAEELEEIKITKEKETSELKSKIDSQNTIIEENKKTIDNHNQSLAEVKQEKENISNEIIGLNKEKEAAQTELDGLKKLRIIIAKTGEEVKQAYEYIKEWYREAGMKLPNVSIDWSDL